MAEHFCRFDCLLTLGKTIYLHRLNSGGNLRQQGNLLVLISYSILVCGLRAVVPGLLLFKFFFLFSWHNEFCLWTRLEKRSLSKHLSLFTAVKSRCCFLVFVVYKRQPTDFVALELWIVLSGYNSSRASIFITLKWSGKKLFLNIFFWLTISKSVILLHTLPSSLFFSNWLTIFVFLLCPLIHIKLFRDHVVAFNAK